MKSIDKFEQNSYEAVALFAVYICLQDGKLSDQEASELFMQSDVMKNNPILRKIIVKALNISARFGVSIALGALGRKFKSCHSDKL